MFSLPIVTDKLAILYTIPEFIPDGRRGRLWGRGTRWWVGPR